MRYGKRRGGLPVRFVLIAIAVVIVAGIGGVFWFAGQAENDPPPQEEIRVEATNVGAQ